MEKNCNAFFSRHKFMKKHVIEIVSDNITRGIIVVHKIIITIVHH